MTHRTCAVDLCPSAPRSGRAIWCNLHYFRWYRHGDPTVTLTPGGTTRINGRGYLVASGSTHPLARRGEVLVHRATLYDAIGPDWHQCHWCGRPVTWAITDLRDRRALTVDHVDGDRLNNTRANLVPSCMPCNAARANSARGATTRSS